MTTFDQAIDHLSQYVAEDGRLSMNDICAFARLHTDLQDAQFTELAHRLIENGINVYDLEGYEEAQIVEEIEERERNSIRENTQIYMRDVGTYDLLTQDEEITFARAMNSAVSEVLQAIAPVKPVNDVAQTLFTNHLQKNRLERILNGFLDPVEILPKVDGNDANGEKSERQLPFDLDLAERRIKHFQVCSDAYFRAHWDARTNSQQSKVEESFRWFRFSTNHYTAFCDTFKDLIASTQQAIERAKGVFLAAGMPVTLFQEQIQPNLTALRLKDAVHGLPHHAQSKLTAHFHVIDRVRRTLEALEQQSQLPYLDLLARNVYVDEAIRRYREAKSRLVAGNLRLVMRVAQTYNHHGALLLDLVQEGNLGLIRAAEKYDYTRGFRFSTYATWWIRQAVTQALNEFGRTVRLPTSLTQSIRTVGRARTQLTQSLGKDPTLGELATKTGLTVQQVRDVVLYEHNAISIDEPINDEEDTNLVDTLVSESVLSPEQMALKQGLRDAVELTLADLTTREAQILTLRYGIGRNTELSSAEIAQDLGISTNRVRQIIVKALRRLRQPRYTPLLEPYL